MKLYNLPIHTDEYGFLTVMQDNLLPPFTISRIFTVFGVKNAERGKHAHIKCSQLLVCMSGQILVSCSDGEEKIDFLLNKPSLSLLIPPGIWSEQKYLTDNSILTVFCDRVYESNDYIHDFSDFLDFRTKLKNVNMTSEFE